MKISVRAVDIVMIVFFTIGIAVFSSQIYGQPASNPVVRIESSGSDWLYALDEDATPVIPGKNDPMPVTIRDGEAFVEWCDCCPQRICVSTGSISRTGEWIVCLPNEIFISIEGGEPPAPPEVDMVVY
jgi:hypothetical protein